jgi:hypothetical protein
MLAYIKFLPIDKTTPANVQKTQSTLVRICNLIALVEQNKSAAHAAAHVSERTILVCKASWNTIFHS